MAVRTFLGMAAAAAVVVAFGATPAAAACCEQDHNHACCKEATMACCDKDEQTPAAVGVLIPQLDPKARPARETITVWFKKPTKVGDRILMGRYIIEHDNDRMARGLPCTHIYEASDPRLPVVAFHCTHLERAPNPRASVTVVSLGEPNGMSKLREFQFAGELGAHGAPGLR